MFGTSTAFQIFFTSVIFKKICLIHKWILLDTTSPGQSEPGSNSNKGVLHTPLHF